MHLRSVGFISLYLLAGLLPARSQQARSVPALQFDHYSLREGLPSNTVNTILQDRFGFLWIGTPNGLARFDGYHFKTYAVEAGAETSRHSGISGSSVKQTLEDRSGRLWIATWNGVNRYHRATDSFVHYLRDPEPQPGGNSRSTGYILGLYEDRGGTIWVGTPTGLFRYNAEEDSLKRHAPHPEIEVYDPVARETKVNEIHAMLEDQGGRFWVATYDNVYQFDRDAGRFIPFVHKPDSAYGQVVRQGYSFFETSRGDLWIVAKASDGIDRFDPLTGRATRYRLEGVRTTPDYVSSNAPSLQEDASGHLWLVATEGDLYRWDEATTSFRRVNIPVQTVPIIEWGVPPRTLLELENGDVLFGSGDQGLIRIHPDLSYDQHLYDPRAAVSALNNVRSVFRDRFGSVWIGARQGLYRLNPDASLFTLEALSSSSIGVTRTVEADGTGGIWIGLAGSKLVYQPSGKGTPKTYQLNRPFVDSLWIAGIEDLAIAQNGHVWITGGGGINVLDPSVPRFRYIGYADTTYGPMAIETGRSMASKGRTVASILKQGDGANRSVSFRLSSRTDLLVLALGECSSPALGMDDDAWIEDEAGERVWSMDPWRVLHAGGQERNKMQMEVISLPPGAYRLRNRTDYCGDDTTCHAYGAWNVEPPIYPEWYGIQVFRLEPGEVDGTRSLLEPWAPVEWLPGGQTLRIHDDRMNRRWIGTMTHLTRVEDDGKRFVSFALPKREGQVGGDGVIAIHDDARGTMWIGTARDLLRFEEQAGRFSRIDIGAQVPVVRIATDERGNVWFATDGRGLGLFRVDKQQITWFSTETVDLPSNRIMSMERDESGRLWLLTAAGLTRFDPLTETLITFNQSHGLPSFSLGGASVRTPAGELVFSGDNGFVRFRTADLRANPTPPQVTLTSLTFSGQNAGRHLESVPHVLTGVQRIELPHNFNDFTVDYVGLHFARPERNQYMVKLDNFDGDWQRVGDRRSRSFTNLDPGRYVFRVRAANADGIWSDTEASLEIVVHPPWWRTLWAYLGYALLLVGGLYGAATTQRIVITARERRRSEIESTRLRAEAAELESRALKAESERQKNAELLSRIGRDITGTLSIEQIIDTVYANVNALMDATIFGIGIADEELGVIEFPATREKGTRLAPFVNRLDDPNRIAVHCFKHRKEILIGDWDAEINQYLDQAQPPVAGDYSHSVLYLPLVFKDRTVGVITAQSFEKQAYTEYHLDLLRNLATYTAIALDNADAYRRLTDTLEHLQATQQQLVTQEKLASLGALTAGIAHEIKNPLNFVNNFADLIGEIVVELRESLEGDGADAEELLADLEQNAVQIAKHGKRADTIVRNMMAHASGGNLQRSEVDVNELVREYADLAYHGKRALSPDFFARVEVSAAQDLPPATIAAQEIGRVLLNLVGNALDAMEEKARTAGESYTPLVTVSTASVASGIEIRVSDNGPGIPQSHRDRVFEPFFTTKSAGKGTGLGLSLSYDIITKGHGGSLRIEDEPDGATTFIIELPLQSVEMG